MGLALLAGVAHIASAGTVQYVYDEAGRLVEVIAPSGESARYTYDAAGNIKAIQRFGAAVLSIAEFSPNEGMPGAAVTVQGTGFSTTPSANAVKFNGVAATVTAATATRLTVTVPTGATTGLVSVTVGGNTVTSTQAFTVLSSVGAAPVISTFSPASGEASTVVTLSGSNFDPDRTRNFLTLNGRPVSITSTSATQIVATVPPEATSGRFRLATPRGVAFSPTDFFVPPSGVAQANVVQRARLSIDGASLTAGPLPVGKAGLYVFDGTAGQQVGLGVSNLTASIEVRLHGPNGTSSSCSYMGPPGNGCNLPPLPMSGTYTLSVVANAAASFSLTLSTDLTGSLTAGTPTVFNSSRPGQNGRYSFTGTAGKGYSLLLNGMTVGATVTIAGPDGRQVGSTPVSAGGAAATIDIEHVANTGLYSVFVDPSSAAVGQVSLSLVEHAAAALAADGPPVAVTLSNGQRGRLSFAGLKGQQLGLGITGVTVTPSNGTLRVNVHGPTGELFFFCNYYLDTSGNASCNLPALPANGNYVVRVDPPSASAATLTLTLSNDQTGTLTANTGVSATFNSARAGRNGRFTFAGTAGGRYSIVPSNITITGSGASVTVFAPDGSSVATGSLSASGSPYPADVESAPATGTYTVFVDPHAANTGQVSLSLTSSAAGTLAVDGASTVATLLSGQNGRYTFSGALGQKLGLGLSALSTSPAGGVIRVSVIGPTGVVLTPCNGGSGYGTSGGACNLPPLPAAGTYTVFIDPQGTYAAAATLTLSNDLAGTISVDAASATTFSSARPGQNGRYVFSGNAGQRYSITLSGVTVTGGVEARVFAPDGAQLGIGSASPGASARPIDLGPAPATGTYTVFVDPSSANTGQVSLNVSSNLAATLVVDGPSLPVTLPAGRNARITFTGAAGQQLGLGLTAMSTSPANGTIEVKVIGSNGVDFFTCGSYAVSTPAVSCNLPALPAAGTYTVHVDPQFTNSAAATLTLSSDIAANLTVDATAVTTFATTRFGQNGRYAFTGVAGTNYSIAFSGITIPGAYTYMTLFAPDGSQVGNSAGSSTAPAAPINLTNAPASGTYVVLVDPLPGSTGSVGLRVTQTGTTTPDSQTPNGSLTVDGAPTAISVPANQTHRYTFAGIQGQTLGLGGTGIVTVPAGASVSLTLTRPDNTTTLTTCAFSQTGFGCTLPRLPSTGTYTLRVTPSSGATVSASVYVSSDLTGSLTVNATTATKVNLTRPGQSGRYSFSGTAGKDYTLTWSGATFASGNPHWIYVYKPDGSLLASNAFGPGAYGIDLPNVPATGTYTVVVDPGGAGTGQVDILLRESAAGSLTVNGVSTAVSLATGQNGRYTFSGSAGQWLGLGVTNLVTVPAGVSSSINVYAPGGDLHTSCGYGVGSAWSCNLKQLPQSGVYAVVVDPPVGYSASLNLTLSTDIAGTLMPNAAAPTTFNSTRPGQNGRFTFASTIGKSHSLHWSGSTLSTPGNLYVLAPDGSAMTGWSLTTGSVVNDLVDLPATGTYTVFIDTTGGNTGQADLLLRETATGAIVVNGPPLGVSLAGGQNGRYSFNGVAGQTLGLGITAQSTVPAGGYLGITLFDDNGVPVTTSGCTASAAEWACTTAQLKKSGVYSLRLDPSASVSASATVTLSSDQAGLMTVNATAPLTFNTTRKGQNGRFSFLADAGSQHSLIWTDAAIDGGVGQITVHRPDGTVLAVEYIMNGTTRKAIDLGVLGATGSYVVVVDPAGAKTGAVSLAVTKTQTSILTVDAPATMPVSLLTGQQLVAEFTAAAGANLGLLLDSVTTSPGAPSTNPLKVELLNPAGVVLTTCNAGATDNASCKLPQLRETGTFKLRISPAANAASFGLRLRSTI